MTTTVAAKTNGLTDDVRQIVAKARETWGMGDFDLIATMGTVRPAATLVRFANVAAGERVLDVGAGTGVVALTAARAGAKVTALDLSPELVAKGRKHAELAGVKVDYVEGDAQEMRFPDASFDLVVSQFGHMFAPDPARTTAEMLRVLRPGGRIAFSTWPPEMFVGRMFALFGKFVPPPAAQAPPGQWGAPETVRERLGARVKDLVFRRDALFMPSSSAAHYRALFEAAFGPTIRVVQALQGDAAKLASWRREWEALIAEYFEDNVVRQDYLMTRAVKA